MGQHPRRREAGFSFIEVAFGLVVMVICAVVLVQHLTVNFKTTAEERERVFAYNKAQAILAEIQNLVDQRAESDPLDLNTLDDGVGTVNALTVATDSGGALLAPNHVLSGNVFVSGQWQWSRRITVQPFAGLNNRNVRYVTVQVFKRDLQGNERPIADLSSVISSAAAAYPTSQVLDVYLLAVENIPGWWVYMESIKPFVESMITDLETRNPGLVVRSHWITKASYGRDPVYRPRINSAVDSWQTMPEAYVYPGLMPAGNASAYYYVPDLIKARMSVDGRQTGGFDAALNAYPYALADFFNHAKRLPEVREITAQRTAAAATRAAEIRAARQAGNPPPPELHDMSTEPTLHEFFEDLCTDPDKYRNALLINLHGELLPMPALRNYSDAARLPDLMPEIRVVTHPEELRTDRTGSAVNLRVYAYTSNAATYTGSATTPRPIAIEVMDMDLTDGASGLNPLVRLSNLRGGVPVGGTRDYYPMAPAKHVTSGLLIAGEMSYWAEFVDPGAGERKFTRIYLNQTPVIAPQEADDLLPLISRGVFNNTRSRLYGMEYVPSPTELARDFSRDLYTPGDGPKNTARWVLRIPQAALTSGMFIDPDGNKYDPPDDVLLTVRTRLWAGSDPANSGTAFPVMNDPANLSTTYTWWADSADDVPFTERSQFQGDPRHCPYKDCFNGDPDFPNSYNRYLDNLVNGLQNAAADFPAINAALLLDRWSSNMNVDVPRFLELLRTGVTRSRVVYTTLAGFSYYYLGLGADIGSDADNGYPNSIPVEWTPFGAPSAIGYMNTITGARRVMRSNEAAGYWWGMPWLGELCPDNVWNTQWVALDGDGNPRGNLTAGTALGQFHQRALSATFSGSTRLAWGTQLLDAHQRMAGFGCTSLFNIGTNTSSFHHQSTTGTGTVTAAGSEISTGYNLSLPATAPISRPFGIATAGAVGHEFAFAPYSTNRHSATLMQTYYTHSGGTTGSGLVRLRDPAGTNAAYIVVNGFDRTISSGTSFLASWSFLSLVHSFHLAGDTANPNRITQLPRVELLSPTETTELIDPSDIDIEWQVDWRRWDGQPYATSGTYGESEADLRYVLMYSRDAGNSWLHVLDESPATPGVRPTNAALMLPDAGAGNETFNWPTPSVDFPRGGYLLRVEAYRGPLQLHYATHQTYIFIQR